MLIKMMIPQPDYIYWVGHLAKSVKNMWTYFLHMHISQEGKFLGIIMHLNIWQFIGFIAKGHK